MYSVSLAARRDGWMSLSRYFRLVDIAHEKEEEEEALARRSIPHDLTSIP